MSQSVNTLEITLKAAADLSAVQYYVVKMSAADTINIATARTDTAIGFLQNKPKTGENAVVRVLGTSKGKAWGTFGVGAYVTATADGRIMAANTNKDHVIGISLEAAAADGDIVEVLITHFVVPIS